MFRQAVSLCVLVLLLLCGADPALAARAHRPSAQQINAPVNLATEPVAPAEGAAQPVAAPEGEAAAPATAEEHHEEGSGGLPQMDISRYPGQIFWLVITFILTYVLMRFVALPKVEQTLDTREKRISADIGGSKAKNEAAKHMMSEYEGRLTKARADAQNATRTVTEESNAKAAQVLAAQSEKVNAQIKQAEANLNAQKAKAIAALDAEVVSVVGAIVKSVADISPSASDIQGAIQKARSA